MKPIVKETIIMCLFISILVVANESMAADKNTYSIRIFVPKTQYSKWLDRDRAEIHWIGYEYTFFYRNRILYEISSTAVASTKDAYCPDASDAGLTGALRVGYRLKELEYTSKFFDASLVGLAGYRYSTHSDCKQGYLRRVFAHSLQLGGAYDIHLGKGRVRFNARPQIHFEQGFRSRGSGAWVEATDVIHPLFNRSLTLGMSMGVSF